MTPDPAESMNSPTRTTKSALARALLACPSMARYEGRSTIIQELRDAIKRTAERSANPQMDVTNLINTALNYDGGLTELIEAVRSFEGDSIPMRKVDRVVAEWHNATPKPPPDPEPLPTPSASLSYERGFERLGECLSKADPQTMLDSAVLKGRLQVNLGSAEQAGLTPELRAERERLVQELNALALAWCGQDFEALSRLT